MPNNELKRYFRTEKDISLKTLPNQGRLNLSKYFVFSKTHSDYLQSNPTAWQVVGFIASNSVKNILFTPKEIAKTLCTSEIEIKKYLSWLVDIGAVIKNKENYIPTKENFFLPSDPEFQKLRSINFRETSQRLSLKIKDEDPKNIQDFKFTYGGTLNEQTSLLIKEHLEQVRDFITSKNDINGKYFEIVIGMAPLKN